jgi:hypothetical protein
VLQRFAGPFKEFGFPAGLLYVIDRVMQEMSPSLRLHVYELMVQPIPDTFLLPPRFRKQLEIREIKPDDPAIALLPIRPDVRESRFGQNAVCLGGFRKGELIGAMWFCPRAYEEDEVRCTYVVTPAEEAVFDFDFYIFPEHRMGIGFAGIWDGANDFLRARGVRFSFSRVTRFNLASRRAHAHLGALIGRAVFLRAWGLEIMMATIFPYVHVSARKSGRARLVLRPSYQDKQSLPT